MKGYSLIVVLLFTVLSVSAKAETDKIDHLVLSGPFASVSHPLIHMVETGALSNFAHEVSFKPWNSTDQLKLMATDKANFKADFVAMPTNVAANLYNRGVELQLINVSVWGILWMVSREDGLKTLADFKDKEIAIPFRADMPDIVFEELALAQGLDPKKDFKLRYVANPLDATQLLILRRVDHALLAEPAVSMALRRTQSFPMKVIAPDLYRSVDLQAEWGRVFNTQPKIPQAGMVALKSVKDQPALVDAFYQEYQKSAQWIVENPKEASIMIAKYIDRLTPEAIEDSLSWVKMEVVSAADAKQNLAEFFDKLMLHNPALVGGKQPDSQFYYQYSAE